MLDGVHPHDVAQTLDSFGVAVRAGHHCAQPLMDRFDLDGTTRVSIAPYNDNSDIDALLAGVLHRGADPAMSDELYQTRIVALAKSKTGAGKLAAPTKSARRDNPLCGDRVTIDVKLDDTGHIAEIAHQVRGCLLCQASAAALRLDCRRPRCRRHRRAAPRRRTRSRPGSRQGARAVRRLRTRRRAQVAPRMRAAAVRGAEGALVIVMGPRASLRAHDHERAGMRAVH
jgi:hypothetical protein